MSLAPAFPLKLVAATFVKLAGIIDKPLKFTILRPHAFLG